MNATLAPTYWYNNHCIPCCTISACSDDAINAYQTWSKFLVALDIAAFGIILAATTRRWLLVDEPFNTLRMILIKLIIGLPLYAPFKRLPSCAAFVACLARRIPVLFAHLWPSRSLLGSDCML